jgi:molybdenum-dependent DNA-binding transcriptional regulator ModE
MQYTPRIRRPLATRITETATSPSDRIGRRIRLRDLHIVLAVAEAGSTAKAAQKLAISHPVVSKAISDLEQTLSVKL